MKKLLCATHEGNEAKIVTVEAVFVRALPGFCIVGLPSQSIQESKDRVKAALSGIGFKFPAQKITLNLSPSDLKKEGSHFDLAIALLVAFQKEIVEFDNYFVFGELGLDGSVKSTTILFSILLSLATKSKKNLNILLPKDIAKNACMIPRLNIYGVDTLDEAIDFFSNEESKKSYLVKQTHSVFSNSININNVKYVQNNDFPIDFKDIKGQTRAKRAALISAAGMHNLLLEGSPGCGKSMTAKRLQYILPPMNTQEILEITSYKSLNKEENDFEVIRPFRSPHHSSTKASIFGGGSINARLGEVALAHNGILFFDEFPHFGKQILESLREPLEDKQVLISRVNSKIIYKTKFIFIAAQNPCPCGNLYSHINVCKCTDLEIKRYKSRLSSPLLDRIDLYVQMEKIKSDDKSDISSSQMYHKVIKAFIMQKNRKQKELNAMLEDKFIEKYCKLNNECEMVLSTAISKFGLSQRGINKIIKISRTIADLDEEVNIQKHHLLEALSFRIRI